jgi:acetoin utilization deacetylase AcuC-like enzyme
LSLHGEKNFPFRKEAGDLDVGLPDGTGDADYLATLDDALSELDERCKPDVVFFLAGADPFEGDRLGRLKLTFAGMQARDQRVLDWCLARRLPVVMLMAGGYGVRIEETVQVQLGSYQLAYAHWKRWCSLPS